MRSAVYARRVVKELLRDPLSYIFCLGFPVLMLIIFSVINSSIPAQAQMDVFKLRNISPGIGMFGLTFIMLFTSLQISKDRESKLLLRLYASPMTAGDFIIGYAAPIFLIALAQLAICFAAAGVIGLITGESIGFVGSLCSIISLIPSVLMFIALGVLFGSILNDKAAPGVTSIIITAASLLGGVWMPLEQMEGLRRVCACLPFYHSVEAARAAMNAGGGILKSELIVIAYTVVLALASVLAFKRKMKA